jgi:CBS domain-containing membrane protein
MSRRFVRLRRLSHQIAPGLPGLTIRGQLIAIVGTGIAVMLVALTGAWVDGHGESLPWIAPPVASSAVLIFTLPTSPMAQPWPVLAGDCLSALVGIALGHMLGHDAWVCALAVALAITAMMVTRSLHPPGGAAALLGVVGTGVSWSFPLAPLGLNLVVLIGAGWLFHRVTGTSYPHAATNASARSAGTLPVSYEEDIDAVLADVGEALDIEREELHMLLSKLAGRLVARNEAEG